MPDSLRHDYEALDAESAVFYPSELIATDGPGYDRLVREVGATRSGWETRLESANRRLATLEKLSAEYVTLAVPLQDVSRRIALFRKEALDAVATGGRSSEQIWKLLGNSLFGAIASRHFPVGNVVAANIITAAGRAAAWAIFQALNGFQVVTDGCTYRRDQIPEVPLAECLRLDPDYLICRVEAEVKAEGRIPFVPADRVPLDDAKFQKWLHKHVRWFLGQEASSPVDRFRFEHKAHRGRPCFDALVCDGVSNDIKLARSSRNGRWIYLGSSRRGYNQRAKRRIVRWAVQNLRRDRLRQVPPLNSSQKLLGIADAQRITRQILQRGAGDPVIVPLGFARKSLQRYKPVRLSAFLCANECQRKTLLKQFQNFERKHHLGFEALAFRQKRGTRPEGSVRSVVQEFGRYIRLGRTDLTEEFHTNRQNAKIQDRCRQAGASRAKLRQKQVQVLEQHVQSSASRQASPLTEIWCDTLQDVPRT